MQFSLLRYPALAIISLSFSLPVLMTSHCQAADIYITPDGAGSRDGASWENAKSGSRENFPAAWNALAPGDTLHVGSGNYHDIGISAAKGGTEGKSVHLVGEDKGSGLPVFTSNFQKSNPGKTGGTFFEARTGASNFEISGIRLKDYKTAVYLRGGNANIKISNLDVEEAREGIRSEGGATVDNPDAGTHNVSVSDCKFIHFTKGGIRLQEGNYNWKIERCIADAGGKEWGTEPFHECYHVIGSHAKKGKPGQPPPPGPQAAPDHHIEFYDCVAENAYNEATHAPKPGMPADPSKQYWNGDGFCDEAACHHIRFVRCVSMHNTDGGWDLKSDAPEFIDCVSLDNKENYRLWSTKGAAKMVNCISGFAFIRGGTGHAAGLWGLGSIDAQYCTFINNDNENFSREKEGAEANIVFRDSIFVNTNGHKNKMGSTDRFKFENCVITETNDPRISATKTTGWPKLTTAYDSVKYGPAQGFSSTRWDNGGLATAGK